MYRVFIGRPLGAIATFRYGCNFESEQISARRRISRFPLKIIMRVWVSRRNRGGSEVSLRDQLGIPMPGSHRLPRH
jgi:hypothetical protein